MWLYLIDFLDYVATWNQAHGKAQIMQFANRADKLENKEWSKGEKGCLEDTQKAFTRTSMLVERLCYSENGKYHRRKLNQGQADQEFVSEELQELQEDIVFLRSNL